MKKLFIIIVLIFSTQLAQSQECNLNPERGVKIILLAMDP